MDDQGLIPSRGRDFPLHHHVQTGWEVHPASYSMGTRGSFPGVKLSGPWSWPLTTIQCRSQECVVLYLHFPIHLHGMVLN